MSAKRIVIAVGMFAVVLTLVWAVAHRRTNHGASTQGMPLRIPDTRFMGILPLYIAEEQGFFRKQGVELRWIDVRDPGQAEKLFHAGQADLIMTTFANLMPAEARLPGTLRLLYPICELSSRPGSFILVRPDSDITSLQDLRGKSVGTYSGPSQKAYALIVLRKLGFKEPEDVRLVQVASATQVQGLFGGSYDALFTVETYGSTAVANGARVLEEGVRTKYISDPFWLGAAAVKSSWARENPAGVEAVLKALEEAAAYIEAHEPEARDTLARRTQTEPAVARRCALYKWVPHPTRQEIEQIQAHVDLLADEKLIEKKIDVEPLFMGTANAD
jgi:ABC-type nitrate/sulfonate/bicarbonate transport system substrate-binding protein